jgi:cold shock CspA family protein
LDLAGGDEREWLELKAAACPIDGELAAGYSRADYEWNVAKAVVAMANSAGGVVLLGVDDFGEIIGVDASDPKQVRKRKGEEEFRRNVVMRRILNPAHGWKTMKSGTLKVKNPQLFERLISLEEIQCDEGNVLAILVSQSPDPKGYIEVEQIKEGTASRNIIYARKKGSIGEVFELDQHNTQAIQAHSSHRIQKYDEIIVTWERFIARGGLANTSRNYSAEVKNYLCSLTTLLHDSAKIFSSLSGELLNRDVISGRTKKNKLISIDEGDWLRKDQVSQDPKLNLHKIEELTSEHAPVIELLKKQKRAILLGDAGSGKSSCLRKIAFDEAADWEQDKPWPIFTSLTGYDGHLGRLLQNSSGMAWEDLFPLIFSGQVNLYLDGLNECPAEFLDFCVKELQSLISECPNARVIISTRRTLLPLEFNIAIIEVRPMLPPQQVSFLAAYLEDEPKAERVLDKLLSQTGGRSLASNPILLRIIAEVIREEGKVPVGRAEIFKRFFHCWYKRETEKASASGAKLKWSKNTVQHALSELAYVSVLWGRRLHSFEKVVEILERILGHEVNEFLRWTSQSFLLSKDINTNNFGFWHEVIQEYFCAEYLVERDQDINLLNDVEGRKSKPGTWSLPIAFAFELSDKMSDEFISTAWSFEPLITAASIEPDSALRLGLYSDDLWVRMVVDSLFNYNVDELIRQITFEARLPPKYPISNEIIAVIRSDSFWYVLSQNPHQMEALTSRLVSKQFPWVELISDAQIGYPALRSKLSRASAAIAENRAIPAKSTVLASASTAELCALRRRKILSSKDFLTHWARSLSQTDKTDIELGLVDILRSEKTQIRALIPRISKLYKSELLNVCFEQSLSLRLLSSLARDGVIKPEAVRRDPKWIESILNRMSPINAIRLAEVAIVLPSDLSDEDRTRLFCDVWFDPKLSIKKRTQYLSDLLRIGFLKSEDFIDDFVSNLIMREDGSSPQKSKSSSNQKFSDHDLEDPHHRQNYARRLLDRRWNLTVLNVNIDKNFGFAKNHDFDENLYFRVSDIKTGHFELKKGVKIDAEVGLSFDRSKNKWGFSIKHGRIVEP